MTENAGAREQRSRARRPRRTILLVLAALLLMGGGTAVAVGVAGQDAAPRTPPASSAQSADSRTGAGSTSSSAPGTDTTVPAPAPAPAPATTTPPVTSAPLTAAAPVEVSIPAIGVRSELIPLGLNPDGTLAVPAPGPDYDKAAWFDGSPRPGDVGPSVIEGHVDSAANGPSVFYALGDLVVGDRIEVSRADGSVVAFVVDEVRVVPKNDFPTLDVYGNTSGPELRLITCGGPFDSSAGSYVDNVVVFASLAV